MENQWTPAQQRAIHDHGGTLLVSAAAGSGKTTVLVERVVSLLRDEQRPVAANRLLILTFTNAAAADLRAKVGARLAAELLRDPGNTALRRQQFLLQRAFVGTVDAFCLHLLQKNFSALDIPPDFATADAATLFRLRQNALADVLERAYAQPDFCAFADLYGKGRSDAQAGQAVLEVYDFLRSLPDPERSLEQFCAMWETDEPLEKTVWGQRLLREAARQIADARRLTELALSLCSGALAVYRPALEDDAEQLEALADCAGRGQWKPLLAAVRAWQPMRLAAARGYTGEDADWAKELRNRAKDRVQTVRDRLLACTEEEYATDRAAAAPLVRALAEAVWDFDKTFFAAKLSERVLEFSDFEHLTLRLLRTPEGKRTPMAQRISAQYDVVMVDEYQDTNTLQDAIYFGLANEQADNLFFVGDLKQSIYRFRQADPAVFLNKLEGYAPLGQGYPAQLALDANFRSAPRVIEGINALFEQMMSRELGGVVYGPGQRLVPGMSGTYPGLCEAPLLADTGDAAYIAGRIRRMLAEGFAVREGAATRPCRAEDFCILLRSRAHLEDYLAALAAEGLAVCADDAQSLLEAPHVRPLAALVRLLDNPAQDVYLAAVLLSALGGFVPDDLVRLRAEQPHGSLYHALCATQQPRLAEFYRHLEGLRALARTLPVDELLEQVLARTGFLAAVGAQENGAQNREDVREFVRFCTAGAGAAGLPGAVRAMDAAEATGGPGTQHPGSGRAGQVSVMSIHRSKGMEFPVVFVADLGHRFNQDDTKARVLLHSQLGLGLGLRGGGGVYATAAYRAVWAALRAEGKSEEMRVLYVALTRARDALILPLCVPDEDAAQKRCRPALMACRLDAGDLAQAQSYAEWLFPAAWLCGQAVPMPRQDPTPPPAPAPLPTGLLRATPDPAARQAFARGFAWRYARQAVTQVPAKVSVTSLVHAEEESLRRPAFLSESGMTAAEKGTALHSFLQHADLAAAPQDLAAEAKRQQDLQLLTPELAAQLDWAALERFFASDAFARMARAPTVLREYAFITALPAAVAMQDKQADYGDAKTLVQGVADVVLVYPDHLELLDYKTDHGKTEAQFLQAYRSQLMLYIRALEKRFRRPVRYAALYSFALGKSIPLETL